MKNVLMILVIALLVPALFFTSGVKHTDFGNFAIGNHVQSKLTYSVDRTVFEHTNTNGFYASAGATNVPRANMNSMFSGLSFAIPLKTLPNGPIRYFDVDIPLRNVVRL